MKVKAKKNNTAIDKLSAEIEKIRNNHHIGAIKHSD